MFNINKKRVRVVEPNELPVRVFLHTLIKLFLLQKFCVMAIVSSKFITACHQPPGMNTVSPKIFVANIKLIK